MHVLVLPKWYPGRHDPQLGDFVRKQMLAVARHHRVSVVAVMPLSDPGKGYPMERDTSDGAWELRCYYQPSRAPAPLRKLVNLFRYVRANARALSALHRERGLPDLVHVHILVRPALVACWLQWRWRVPYVISEQSSEYMDGTWDRKGWLFHGLNRMLARRASGFTAVSPHLAAALAQRGLWPAPEVIPNVIPGLDRPLPPPGAVGRFLVVADLVDRIKNVSGVLRALQVVRASGRPARLDVIGDGPDAAPLRILAGSLGIADAVTWHGRLANRAVLDLAGEVQAVIVNSRVETFSVVTGEALALGRPVIATRCGGPERMVNEANGLLIPVDDMGALASAMSALMDAPERHSPTAVRATIAGSGDPEVVGRMFGRIYERILGHA